MSDKQYYVRRPFDYAGEELDRGQIIELKGARNDEKLIRLGYVQELTRGNGFRECGVCFKRFTGEGERNGHAEMRHSDRYKGMTAVEKEAAMEEEVDRQEKRLERDAPLHFENTQASRDAGEGKIEVSSTTNNSAASRRAVKAKTGRVRPAPKPRAGRAVARR